MRGEKRAGTGGNGREWARMLRALFGMPDYAAYCSHLRTHHPDRPLLSEREFFDQFVRARYGDGPTRCC
jgi:uncharacterized short protein YbdD (DUF466 family)